MSCRTGSIASGTTASSATVTARGNSSAAGSCSGWRQPHQPNLPVTTASFGWWGWRHPEQLPAALEFPRAVTVAEEAVVPDAMEPVRQDMDQETADELPAIERHRLLAVAVPVILPAEADLAVVHGQQ